MFYKLRRMSPFTIFWALFYVVAGIGLLVPWDVGQWFAIALAAPMFLITVAICVLLAGSIAWGLGMWCVRPVVRKSVANRPD